MPSPAQTDLAPTTHRATSVRLDVAVVSLPPQPRPVVVADQPRPDTERIATLPASPTSHCREMDPDDDDRRIRVTMTSADVCEVNAMAGDR
jgi:hypothetical protein